MIALACFRKILCPFLKELTLFVWTVFEWHVWDHSQPSWGHHFVTVYMLWSYNNSSCVRNQHLCTEYTIAHMIRWQFPFEIIVVVCAGFRLTEGIVGFQWDFHVRDDGTESREWWTKLLHAIQPVEDSEQHIGGAIDDVQPLLLSLRALQRRQQRRGWRRGRRRG